MKQNSQSFGDMVIAYLTEQGKTNEWFAEQMGCNKSLITKWLDRQTTPDANLYVRSLNILSRLTGKSYQELEEESYSYIGVALPRYNNKQQIRALCRPIDICEGDYLNVQGLLHRIKEYQIKPFWKMSKELSEQLLQNEDVLAVEWLGEHSLCVIKTILTDEALGLLLGDGIRVEAFQRVEQTEDQFYGVLNWRVEE